MYQKLLKTFVVATASLVLSMGAHAELLVQWNFNTLANTSDIKASYTFNGEQAPSFVGLGGVALSLVSDLGSSDPEAGDKALNTTSYAAQGTGDLTRGIQVMVSTIGFENLVLSFDQRNSNTASAWTTLLYTLDGSTWLNAQSFQMTAGGSFVNNRSFDFSSISGANDNANFGIQLLASFAPSTSSFAGTAGAYGTAGTIRYDMLSFSGDVVAVPEPQTVALLLSGLFVVVGVSRRRLS